METACAALMSGLQNARTLLAHTQWQWTRELLGIPLVDTINEGNATLAVLKIMKECLLLQLALNLGGSP